MEANAEKRRRLPSWMLRVNAANELGTSGNKDAKSNITEEQSETKTAKSEVKLIAEVQETTGLKRARKSQMDETKQKSRKASGKDDDASSSIIDCDEAVQSKTKLKNEADERPKRTASTKQSKISRGTANGEVEATSQGSSRDEIELTVEDLLSIAEEYVNADREKEHARVLTGSTGCSQVLSRCTTTKSSSHPSGVGLNDNENTTEKISTDILSRCTMAGCSSDQSESGRKAKESPTTKNIDVNVVRTGDTAQDMLDLFLGPLLKKLPAEEPQFRITKAESFCLVPESKKQVRSMPEGNEDAPLTKKKSSFKDKVSVFLN